MGTYIYAYLKDKSEENILKMNDILEKKGIKTEIHNGVKYGAFVSLAQLTEDTRFMNEDTEGLKQVPHWQRPITPERLQDMFWNKLGLYCVKLSGGKDGSVEQAMIMAKFIRSHRSLFDLKECTNHTVEKVSSYL